VVALDLTNDADRDCGRLEAISKALLRSPRGK
jgi:hypothetical protein